MNLTLLDWAKRRDPSGKTAKIAMILNQTNRILDDQVFRMANEATGHKVTVSTGLPTIYWRAMNIGIPTSKATTAQVSEACAMMEARSEVDVRLARLEDDMDAFRLSEARHFIEGMNQEGATTLIYGNPADDSKKFLGLAPRYSTKSAGNQQNVILGGGTTANQQTSAWLICWGEETVFSIFPKGSAAGLVQQDLGEMTSFDAGGAGLRMQVLAELFQWDLGLVVKDWRYAVRICNLEVPDFAGLTGTQAPTTYATLVHKMIQARNCIPAAGMGRMAWYVNRTLFSGLMRLATEKSNSALSLQDAMTQFGTPSKELMFLDAPIRQCDAILNTESLVA